MVKLFFKTIQQHPIWTLGWALFITSIVFFAGEYNVTATNTQAFEKEFDDIKAERAEVSEAFELMREQQAFFGLFRRFEDEFAALDFASMSAAQLQEQLGHQLDRYDMLRTRLGETLEAFQSVIFLQPRLEHAKSVFLADLKAADALMVDRIAQLERARDNPRLLLDARRTPVSALETERLRRLWYGVESRGEQAQKLLYTVLQGNEQAAERLMTKGEAELRRTYVRWAAMIYAPVFLVAFSIWLWRRHRIGKHAAAQPPQQPATPAATVDGEPKNEKPATVAAPPAQAAIEQPAETPPATATRADTDPVKTGE